MKIHKIFSLLIFGLSYFPLISFGQARLQFIHNSPDVSLDSIDIYVNKTPVNKKITKKNTPYYSGVFFINFG